MKGQVLNSELDIGIPSFCLQCTRCYKILFVGYTHSLFPLFSHSIDTLHMDVWTDHLHCHEIFQTDAEL